MVTGEQWTATISRNLWTTLTSVVNNMHCHNRPGRSVCRYHIGLEIMEMLAKSVVFAQIRLCARDGAVWLGRNENI